MTFWTQPKINLLRVCFFAVLNAFAFFALGAQDLERSAGQTKAPPSLSRLEKLRLEGDIYGFRIELSKLLAEPAKDFFPLTASFFDPKNRRAAFYSMAPSADALLSQDRSRRIDEATAKLKRFFREETALAHVLLPPLGKKDRHGLTPSSAAFRSGNHSAAVLFRQYTAPEHEIYEGEGTSPLWEINSEYYPDKKDCVWRRIPKTPLEKTPAGRALLTRDFEGFLKALDDLHKGPAWKVIALLHSRETKTRKTIFHLLAEARFPLSEERLTERVQREFREKGSSDEEALSRLIEQKTQELEEYKQRLASPAEGMRPLSSEEGADMTLKESFFDKQAEEEAARAFKNMMEAVNPPGLPGFRKDKERAEALTLQAVLFNGTASALSLASSVAAFGMDQNIIGSGLALLAGWTLGRCNRLFKSYKNLKNNNSPPP